MNRTTGQLALPGFDSPLPSSSASSAAPAAQIPQVPGGAGVRGEGDEAVSARARRSSHHRFGDSELCRQAPSAVELAPRKQATFSPERATRHKREMAELASALPEHLRFGTVGWRYPQWGSLVYRSARSAEEIAERGLVEYAEQPLFRALGLPSRELVPSERELLWELLELPDTVRPVVMMNPGLTTPRFPRRSLLDAAPGRPGDAGAFNPNFLEPRLMRDSIVPVLEEVQSIRDENELVVLLTFPSNLGDAGIPPYPLLWRLERLATVLPAGVRLAIEVREADYLTPDYDAFLEDAGAVHVVSLWPGMPSLAEQWELGSGLGPRIVRMASPRPAVPAFGFQGEPELHRPMEAQRRELAALLRDERHETLVLASNAFEGCGPLSLEALAREVIS